LSAVSSASLSAAFSSLEAAVADPVDKSQTVEPPAHNHEVPIMDQINRSQGGETRAARLSIVTDFSALEKLATLRGMFLGATSVQLELCGMGKEEQRPWQAKINRQLAACGCKEGGISVVISLAVYCAYLFLSPIKPDLSGWGTLGFGFGIALIAGAAGKLIGLLRARAILRGTILRLRIECAHQPISHQPN
jgi:hypothetical protein